MIIEQSVTINRYPFTDQKTNKVIHQDPIVLDKLEVSFIDSEKNKAIYAKIEGYPVNIPIYSRNTYDALGDYTKSQLEQRFKELAGDNIQEYLQKFIPRTLEADPHGPGSILSGMLSSLGIKSSEGCSCKRRAVAMNVQGPDWCEENKDTILSWLEEESKKRKLPFVKMIADAMVSRAIKKSRRLLAKHNE